METLILSLSKYYDLDKKAFVYKDKKEEFFINLLLMQAEKLAAKSEKDFKLFFYTFGGSNA